MHSQEQQQEVVADKRSIKKKYENNSRSILSHVLVDHCFDPKKSDKNNTKCDINENKCISRILKTYVSCPLELRMEEKRSGEVTKR